MPMGGHSAFLPLLGELITQAARDVQQPAHVLLLPARLKSSEVPALLFLPWYSCSQALLAVIKPPLDLLDKRNTLLCAQPPFMGMLQAARRDGQGAGYHTSVCSLAPVTHVWPLWTGMWLAMRGWLQTIPWQDGGGAGGAGGDDSACGLLQSDEEPSLTAQGLL